MTDLPFRKILGLNQQTYQRLRLALSLNLRRQIFVAVCDDLELRDRLVARLVEDLTPASAKKQAESQNGISIQPYPRLVTLPLSLGDPNPIAQIAHWLTELPPPQTGNRRAPIPTFQLVGIEQLTREPAAVQRLFLNHLQGIERNLSILESSLILWMPQPWLHALPSSAPDFWRCRTAVFEFVGDPTPLPPPIPEAPSARQPSKPPQVPLEKTHSTHSQAEAEDLAQQVTTTQDDLWKLLARELAELDAGLDADETQSKPDSNGIAQNGIAQNGVAQNGIAHKDEALLAQSPVAKSPVSQSVVSKASALQSIGSSRVKTTATATQVAVPPQVAAKATVAAPPRPPATSLRQVKPTAAPVKTPLSEPPNWVETERLDWQSDPVLLMQQIELLHQEQAPPAALAEAYRILGNLYRDRIEQGDGSPQNLTTAIQAYEQVLVWLQETSDWWTDVLNDLGNLYWMLSRYASSPDQALAHLQQGIQAYQLALSKLNLQLQPNAYPMIHNNLGAAYADLARYQDPIENLQRSIQSYQQALRHRKAESDPLRYASTQNNLGTAYWNLAQHQQPAVYLKQAIAAYSEALHYYNAQQEPLSYAMIQNNLGTAYWNLAQHERPQDWLRLALGAYKVALEYRTLEAAPAAYAATQNNLGTAYWHLANHHKEQPQQRADYLQSAIVAYQATLVATNKLSTPQPVPLNFDVCATHNNLGLAHHQLVSDPKIHLETAAQATHLENSLYHHLQALDGWQQKPELRQTALSCVIQVMRTIYNTGGLTGQNMALSIVPGHLLPEILPKL